MTTSVETKNMEQLHETSINKGRKWMTAGEPTVSSAWEGKDMASQRLMQILKNYSWKTIRHTHLYGMLMKTLKSCYRQNWQQF